MTSRPFWYCIRHELSCRYLCMIFISLVHIIFFYILLDFLVTPGYQKFLITNLVVFHCPPCSSTSVLQYSQITFALNFLFFGTYTFLFFSCHSLSLNILTPACFISSIAFIILLSFASDFLIFSNRSTPSITTSITCVAPTSSHSFFTSTVRATEVK